MRKMSRMLKRTLAMFLAALMVMTAGNFGFVASVFAHDDATDPHVHLSDLIVSTYELTDEEEAIITSGELSADQSYSYILPPTEVKDGGLIAVDEENKKVTVSAYEDDYDNLWIPVSFDLKADGAVVADHDDLALTEEDGVYVGAYTYAGNAFSVEVTYVLNKQVTAAEQQAILNAGSLLAADIAKLMLFEADIIAKPEGWDEMTDAEKQEEFTEEELAEYAKHDALQEFVDSALGKGKDEDTLLTPELILSILVLPALEWEGQTLSAIDVIAMLGEGMTEEVTGIPEELIEAVESDLNLLEWDGETLSAELGFNNANNKVIQRLLEEKNTYGNLLLGKFLMTDHQNDSYLEWLMVTGTYAELVNAVSSNYKDLNQLATNARALPGVMSDLQDLLADLELLEAAAWDMITTTAAEFGVTITNEDELNAALTDEGFDEILASQMGPLNEQLPTLKNALTGAGYTDEADSIPDEITTKAELEALIATLKSVKADAESKLSAALTLFNSELTAYGYTGTVAADTLDADIAAVESWLADRIVAQEDIIDAAVKAANDILAATNYTGTVSNAADIETAITWLTNNAGDELKTAQAVVAEKLVAANTLARSFGYTTEIVTADDLDAVAAWLEAQIAADEATLQGYIDTANGYIAQANAELPESQQYTGTIATSDDIDSVIAWMNDQVTYAEDAYADALAKLNAELTEAGYTGEAVESSADIEGVKEWLDSALADVKTQYAEALAKLNAELTEAGYTGEAVESSADIEGVKEWLDSALADVKTQYAAALAALNTELAEAGYTGDKVESSADIADVKTEVSALFDAKKAEAEAKIADGLTELNGTLGYYGYTGTIAKSTDVAAAVDYMNNDAEAYVWAQVNAQLPTGVSVNSAADVATAKSALVVAKQYGQINEAQYNAAVAALDAAVATVNNISNIVTALNTTKTNLEEAEAGLAAIDTKKVETLAALDEAYTELSAAETQIAEAEAEVEALKDQLDTAYTQMSEAETKIAETEAALPGLKDQLDEAYEQMVAGEQQIADAKAMVTEYTGTLNSAKTVMANLESKIAAAKAALPEQKAQLAAAKAEIVAANEALADVDDPSATVIPALRDEQAKINAANAQIAADKAEQTSVADWKSQLTTAKEAIATLADAIEQMEAGLATANEAYATLESVADNLKVLKDTKAELNSTITMLDILITMLDLFCETIKSVNDSCSKNDWNVRDVLNAYNESNPADYDALTEAATGLTAPEVEIVDSLHVADATVQYNMSMFNVTVQVEATVMDENNAAVKLDAPEALVVTLRKDATQAEIAAAIAELNAEAAALTHWNGVITTDNYDVAYSTLPETLTEDITYVISYTPKMMDMTYGDGFEGDELDAQYPYGYRLTLPTHDDANYEWEYTVNGETKIRQGTVITVTGATTISRKAGAASEMYSMVDLIIDTTGDLTSVSKSILESAALKLDKVVYVRMPYGGLITVAYDDATNKVVVTAPNYDSNVAGDWTVYTGVMDGTEVSFADGEFTTAELFNQIVVNYQLNVTPAALGLTAEDLGEYLNVPYILTTDYHFQKTTLDTLVSSLSIDSPMDDDDVTDPLEALSMLRRDFGVPFNGQNMLLGNLLGSLPTLNDTLGLGLAQTTLDAAAALLTILPQEGNVPLYDTLMTYQSADGGMEHYYTNEQTYIDQIDELADIMNALTADETLMGMLGGYKKQFDTIKDALNAAASLGEEENRIRTDLIDVTSAQLGTLLGYLAANDVKEYADPDSLTWVKSFTKAGPSSVEHTVVVNVLGNEKSQVYTVSVTETFDHAAAHEQILADNNMIPAGDEAFYACTFSEDANVYTYTYNYKVFESVSVNMNGEDVVVGTDMSLENTTITLPVHSNSAEYRYDYTVNGAAYEQGASVNLTSNQFKALINGTLSIERTEINLEQERLEKEEEEKQKAEQQLVTDLGGLGVLTKIDEGKYALVLNLNIDDPMDNLMGFMLGLLLTPYDGVLLGTTDLYTFTQYDAETTIKQLHLQALVDLILNSGLTDEQLLAMIENGAFKNDFALPGTYMEYDTDGNPVAYGDLGTQFVQSTMTFQKDGADDLVVDFYMTLSGSGDTVGTLQSALGSLPEGVSVQLNGGITLSADLPGLIYTAYLAALSMVGEVDIDNMDAATSEAVIGYVYDLLNPVLGDDAVTLTTIENTLAMFDVNYDLSAYESYYNLVKRAYGLTPTYTEDGFTVTLSDINIDSVIAELQTMVDSMELPGGMTLNLANLIYEYDDPAYADDEYGLDVTVGAALGNIADDYDVIYVDVKADGIANKFGMTTHDKLALQGTSVVVLVGDVEGDLVFDGTTTFVDLNGFTVSGNVCGVNGADVYVLDSDYTVSGGAYGVSGTVTVLGGKYTADVTDYLHEGYEVKADGTVGNKLFTLSETDDVVTFTVNTTPEDVKTLISQQGVIDLAAEVLVDLVINNYNAAALTMDGNTIYNINFNDLLSLVSGDRDALVDTALACVSASDLADVFNAIVADLTDYAGMADALADDGDGVISEHDFATAPWAFALGHDADKDVLTVNLGSGELTDKTFQIAVVGDARDDLAALTAAMADTVTVESELDLDDVAQADGVIAVNGSYSGSVIVDFVHNPGYALAMAVIVADGTSDAALKADVVAAIEAYAETGSMYNMGKVFNALSIADISDVLINHINTYDEMVAGLNLSDEAEAVLAAEVAENEMGYELLVDVVAYALFLLDSNGIGESVTGSARTLGSFEKEDDKGLYYGFEKSGSIAKTVSVVDAALEITNVTVKIYLFPDHVCDLTEHTANPATCEEEGNSAYWSCDGCGKFFSDANGKNEIEENSWIISATGHVWGTVDYYGYEWSADGKSCTAKRVCTNDYTHVETAAAVITSAVYRPATCAVMGITTYTATFDVDWAATQTKNVWDIATNDDHDWLVSHKWEEEDGDWYCTATRICRNSAEHNLTERVKGIVVVSEPPTCDTWGTTVYQADFAAEWARQQTHEVSSRFTDHDWSVSYTWSDDGKSCTATRVCAYNADHNATWGARISSVVKTPATCTVMGWTTYTATFTESWATTQTKDVQDIATLDHTFDQKVTTDDYLKSAADCENAAVYYYSCSCGEKGTETFEHGTALGHADAAGDGDHKCDACGDKISDCVDENNDHKCDECGKTVSDCVDANGDYYCDICGKPYGELPVVGEPEIPVSKDDKVFGFAADADEGLLILDTVQSGMTVAEFTALLKEYVETQNDTDNVCDVVVEGDANGLIATGSKVTVTAKNPLGVDSVTYDIVVMGDTNCNGRIESGDAVKIANHYCGISELTGLTLIAGDVNGNGRLESGDAVKISRKYVDEDSYESVLNSVLM